MSSIAKNISISAGIGILLITVLLLSIRQNANSNELLIILSGVGSFMIFIPLFSRKHHNT